MSGRPFFAVSMGDPNGVGPEVLLKALRRLQPENQFFPIVTGSARYLSELAERLELSIDWSRIEVEDLEAFDSPQWGQPTMASGRLARSALEAAVALCTGGRCQALVTAPVSKAALRLAGFRHPGHTEYLAEEAGRRVAMAFFSDHFHLLLATAHIPLREVATSLETTELARQSGLFFDALRRLGHDRPRIAVCGLNPHASEGGLMGDEEESIIVPALKLLEQSCGKGVFSGPHPPDTLFWRALRGEFDGVVALYHDQGLIPLKMVAFDSAVNVTLGLPFVRTSPDHGTAFDIAGQGVADSTSMENAFRWACRLTSAGSP